MPKQGTIKRIELKDDEYEADVSYDLSFGGMLHTMKGKLDLSTNPGINEIRAIILRDSFEDFRSSPAIFAALHSTLDRGPH